MPLSGSERRLFRLHNRLKTGEKTGKNTNTLATSAILIDARREAEASDTPCFVPYLRRLQDMTSFLTRVGLRVPFIEAIDGKNDLAVIEDLGENSYAHALGSRGIEGCLPMFQRAVDDLIRLSRIDTKFAPDILPAFTEERFVEQTMSFADIFLTKEQRLVWEGLWRDLYRDAAFCEGELALVLGDVHIENLFVLDKGERCVFIDFQDAHIAPRCYDIVSLLEDGLWSMPAVQREVLWGCYERAYAGCGDISAVRHYALCALHRELRMIGILHRLSRLRGGGRYGEWLVTTMRRCRRRLAEHSRFAGLGEFLEREIGFGEEGWERRV